MKKLLVKLIGFYQIFSPNLFAGVCKYQVTCSQYTKQAILQYGVIKGGLLGFKRILTCR